MQVSPRRRPTRITPKRPRIMTSLARMTLCISTKLPLPTAPNPIRSCSPINQGTIIRPGTIISAGQDAGIPAPASVASGTASLRRTLRPAAAYRARTDARTNPPQQNFYEGEQADADFLDESQLCAGGHRRRPIPQIRHGTAQHRHGRERACSAPSRSAGHWPSLTSKAAVPPRARRRWCRPTSAPSSRLQRIQVAKNFPTKTS